MRKRSGLAEHIARRTVAQLAIGCIWAATSIFTLTGAALAQTVAASASGSATPVSVREEIAAGERAAAARDARQALTRFESALSLEPHNYAALWQAAAQAIDIGEADKNEKQRDSLYAKATFYARRALEVEPEGAEGNFTMARALGRTALSLGPRERVKFGTDVRMRALKALAANPQHPGAMHVMGVWNSEIMRLNSFTRLIAKTLLGGSVFSTASWAAAEKYLTESVAIDPTRTVHRLDLARVYRDTGREALARDAYQAALRCPLVDANDDLYKQMAASELRALK